jgi:hypothetical protein
MIDYPATVPAAAEPTEWAEVPGTESSGGFARLAEPGTSPGAETYPPDQDESASGDRSFDAGDELAETSPEEGRARTLTIDDLRSNGSINQATPSGGAHPGAARPSPRTRTLTPRGGRFTPGIDSTGRLEPVLVPIPAVAPAIAG